MIPPDVQQAIDALRSDLLAVRRDLAESPVNVEGRVTDIENRIGLWAMNGLNVIDAGAAFAGKGGAYGTSTRFARSDASSGGGGASVGNGTFTLTNPMTGTNGTAVDASRTDMRPTVPAPATPSTSAVGDTSASGAGTGFATDSHKHAREAFATPTVGVGSSYGAGVATTLMRSDATLKIPMALGGAIPLAGGRFKRLSDTTSLPTGNNDIYTAPSSTRTMIGGIGSIRCYNNSAGNITAFAYIQFQGTGTRYQIGTTSGVTGAANVLNLNLGTIILEPGDVLGINVATTSGLNYALTAVEFPSSIPVYSAVVKDPASGNNTIYTCPASTNAAVFGNQFVLLSASPTIQNINGSGGALNIYPNVVPSGSSVSAANQFQPATALAGATVTLNSTVVAAFLNAGDFLSMNWSGANANGLSWVNVAEIAGA